MHGPTEPCGGHTSGLLRERHVARWNEMIHNLVSSNPGEWRLIDLEDTLHLALTRDGLHFNTVQGKRWYDDAFQTKIGELEEELRLFDTLARTSLTARGRVRKNMKGPPASHLGPLASVECSVTPAAPSSDVRERLETDHPPRRQPLESRLEDLWRSQSNEMPALHECD